MKKKHGNCGKQNAKKDITASKNLNIRITEHEKMLFALAAERKNLTVSRWIKQTLTKAATDS